MAILLLPPSPSPFLFFLSRTGRQKGIRTNVVMKVEMVAELEADVDELPNAHVRGPGAGLAGPIHELVGATEIVVLFERWSAGVKHGVGGRPLEQEREVWSHKILHFVGGSAVDLPLMRG